MTNIIRSQYAPTRTKESYSDPAAELARMVALFQLLGSFARENGVDKPRFSTNTYERLVPLIDGHI